MAAKGCNGRGGNANGKKFEGRRHGGGRSGRWARSASRVEKAHETVERRAGKGAISDALADIYDASGEMEAEAALHRAMEGRDMSTEELVAALRGY
jgi:hypothetical protein